MKVKTHEIRAKYDELIVRTVSGARDADQAWGKFKTQYFRGAPMQPKRDDYTIRQIAEREV